MTAPDYTTAIGYKILKVFRTRTFTQKSTTCAYWNWQMLIQ